MRKKYNEFNSCIEGLNTSLGGTGAGLNAGGSLYSKEIILKVFELLCIGTLGFCDIANKLKVPATLPEYIFKQRNHVWLKEEYPEKYYNMLKLILPRSKHMRDFYIKHNITGKVEHIIWRNKDADRLNINRHALSMVKSGIRKHTGGWELYIPK